MLRKLKLSNGAFLAMDRAYIDYKVFEQFTQEGVFYVTKMKKNQRYKQHSSCYLVNTSGLIELQDERVVFTKEFLQRPRKGMARHHQKERKTTPNAYTF